MPLFVLVAVRHDDLGTYFRQFADKVATKESGRTEDGCNAA